MTGTPKALREYSLQGQTATGGLNGCWKIYSAKAKKEGGLQSDFEHAAASLQLCSYLGKHDIHSGELQVACLGPR